MPRKNIFQKWDEQKGNIHNADALEKLNVYRKGGNTFKYGRVNEFKHAISFEEIERDACALKYLKMEANTTQNRLATDPNNADRNAEFMYAQQALRDWRGNYMYDQFSGNGEEVKGVTLGRGKVDVSTYEVLLSLNKNMKRVYVNHKNIDLEDMTPQDILDIITNAGMEDIEWVEPETISMILETLEDCEKGGNYFLGDECFDKTARFALKTGEKKRARTRQNIPLRYRFNINKMLPTKAKIYQNPKVVEKMIVDFLKHDMPAMHADLTVHYDTEKNEQTNTLVWTIHKLDYATHIATNLTYISKEDNGLFELPETLAGLKKMRDTRTFSEVSQHQIDPSQYSKHNDTEMMNLHAFLKRDHVLNLLSNESPKDVNGEMTSYGFIYEYVPDYTIIASTIVNSSSLSGYTATAYTIIHWNPNLKALNLKPVKNKFKEMEEEVDMLKLQIDKLNTGYDELSPFKFGLDQVDTTPQDYFIPGILSDIGYARGSSYSKQTLGGYVIQPDYRTKVLLEHNRHTLEIDILKNHILPHFGMDGPHVYKELETLVLGKFTAKRNGRPEFIQAFPGFMGKLLMGMHDDQELIQYVKKWTVDWNAFLTTRGIKFVWWSPSRFDKLNADIQDRKILKKKSKAPRTLPNRNFERSSVRWDAVDTPLYPVFNSRVKRSIRDHSRDNPPYTKMQAEVDELKRTLNKFSLTLI